MLKITKKNVCKTYVEALFEGKVQLFKKIKTPETLIFPGFVRLFTTALFILATTSTWLFVLGLLGAFGSTWLVNSALGCTWEHSVALGKPSRTYLKTYLKFIIVELFTTFELFFSIDFITCF